MIHVKNDRTGARHEHQEQNWLITISLVILAVVALAGALIYTRTVMIPFVVALFIVALVSPIEDFQVRRLRLPRVIAILVTLLVVLSVIAIVSLFVAQAIRTIAYTAKDYSTGFANMAEKLLDPLKYVYQLETPPPSVAPETPKPKPSALPSDVGPVESKPEAIELFPVVKDADKPGLLGVRPQPNHAPVTKGRDKPVVLDVLPPLSPPAPTKGPDKPAISEASPGPNDLAKDSNEVVGAGAEPNDLAKSSWHDTMRQLTKELIANARQMVRDLANHMFNTLKNTVGAIFGLLSGVLLICVFVIFLLAGRNPYAEHSQMYADVVGKIRRYLGTKVITSALVGVLVWTSLAIIGMELAGVFGILAFLLNFIPVIGPIIVTVLPIPIAMAQFQSPWRVALVVIIPGGIHNVIGNIIEPKLMGEGLDLHPVTILLALSFWGLLWGIMGMFLAAPIMAVLRIVLMQFDTFQPIANLLAGDFSKPRVAADIEPISASARSEETEPDGSLPG
jgi:AI-2 transport protein TqsA